MKIAIHKLLLTGVIIILLVISSIILFSHIQNNKASDTIDLANQTRDIVLIVNEFAKTTLYDDNNIQKFIISGDEKFLKPLAGARQQINKYLDSLSQLITPNNKKNQLIDSLRFLTEKRIQNYNSIIDAERTAKSTGTASLFSQEKEVYTPDILQISKRIETLAIENFHSGRSINDNYISRLNTIQFTALVTALVLSVLITFRIRSDLKNLEISERKFGALLDSAPDATVIVNEDGRIEMVNQQAINLFGYDRDEILLQPVEILVPGDMRGKHIAHRKGFVKYAKVRPMGAGIELRAIKKNGSFFPVEISLSPIKTEEGLLVAASIRDITDRKKSEEKFRSLLNAAPDATVIVNETGIIQMINTQTEQLFEYTREELIGQPVERLIPPELREKHAIHRSNFVNEARVRAMGAGIELNAIKKNGQRFPVEISLSPLHTDDGLLVSAAVRDITHRKKLENELKKTNEEIEAFTYSVSHDLRAPLRGIVGFTSVLEEDYAPQLDMEGKRITAVIKANTLKMGQLIDDLLSFSRTGKQELIKVKVNTSDLVKEIINENFLTEYSKNGNPITWSIGALASVQADVNTFRQVWINLISNSVKYSSKNKNSHISIGSYSNPGEIVFYVRDNGVGFNEKYMHKLFSVFQRLHDPNEFEGTGVGLALVKKIISKHGGKVWAEGRENEGACFYFTLPA